MRENSMSKIKDYSLDNPLERISADDEPKENPFEVEESDMTYEELQDDRGGVAHGSPLGGWN